MASSPRPPGPFNLQHHHHRYHPSVSSALETLSASDPDSTARADPLPAASPRSSSFAVRSRAASSASSTYSTSSAVRRKPLPLSASHLALQQSPDRLGSTFESPADVFARHYALDSPTLYEFPSTSTAPFTPASSAQRLSK
jgi:hypothetical protein